MKEATAIILMVVFLIILIFVFIFINIFFNNNTSSIPDDCPEGCNGKKCKNDNKCQDCLKCCCYDFQCEKCNVNPENDGIIRENNEQPKKILVSKEEHPYRTHSKINDIVLRKNRLIKKINKKVKNLNEEL